MDIESTPVHWAHFKDGYPLCWPMDREGEFRATRIEADVTCDECKNEIKDY